MLPETKKLKKNRQRNRKTRATQVQSCNVFGKVLENLMFCLENCLNIGSVFFQILLTWRGLGQALALFVELGLSPSSDFRTWAPKFFYNRNCSVFLCRRYVALLYFYLFV